MKKITSIIMALCMMLSLCVAPPAFAEDYSVYASATGTTWTDSTNQGSIFRYYDTFIYWQNSGDTIKLTDETNGTNYTINEQKFSVGRTAKAYPMANLFRFPIPELQQNHIVTSAILEMTVKDVTYLNNEEFAIYACAYSPGKNFGSKFSSGDIGTFEQATANAIAGTDVPATAKAGDKIKIDVSEYVKTCTTNVDIVVAAKDMQLIKSAHYVDFHSSYAETASDRPVLKLTTAEDESPAKILSEDVTDACVNGFIAEIEFSREMDFDTLTADNIIVSPGDIPVSRVNYSGDKTIAKIALDSNLLYDTTYSVSFNDKVKTAGGLGLEAGAEYSFTTETSPDAEKMPSLISSFPKKNAGGVKAISSVTLDFDKELYQPSVKKECFTMKDKDGAGVNISSVVLHPEKKSVFVYFDKALDYQSSYTLSFTELSDLSGNVITDSISFDTADAAVIIKAVGEVSAENATEEQPEGSILVTVENTTGANKTITLVSALYEEGPQLKECLITKDVTVSAGESTAVLAPFSERSTSDIVRVFGFESLDTLVPIFNSSIGAVDKEFYPGYVRKAVTLSYDDALRVEFIPLLEGFNEKGIKSTINVVSQRINRVLDKNNPTIFEDLINAGGHEIALHGKTHEKITWDTKELEFEGGRNELEFKYNKPVLGIAYPHGAPSARFDEITEYAKGIGIKYARCSDGTGFDIPEDFMSWDFSCHHNYLYSVPHGEGNDYAERFFDKLADDGTLKLLSVWGHAHNFEPIVEETTGEETQAETWSTVFEPFTDKLKAELTAGRIWNPTNIEFVEYINSVNSLVVRDDSVYNPGTADVYIKINGREVIVPAGGTVY